MSEMEIITGHAFSDITVDLLGSKLAMTAKRNKYLLTIICNSTWWLHEIPLTNCKTENIADQLLQYFCQVGFLDTIRSDNANQFRSEILAAVRDRLGIKARFSAPCHPESHGRIERANRTLLEMLKKFIHDHPSRWDQKLPYLLFALREIPSASSKFSPYELLYGRKARGLLSHKREDWTGRTDQPDQLGLPAAKYVEQLGERIANALKAAGRNVKETQLRNKANYDRRSTVRSLEPGNDALVLMLNNSTKLFSQWCGHTRSHRGVPTIIIYST